MPAPKGNTNNTKLRDATIKQVAYDQYCEHLASGYPKECFVFDHEDYPDVDIIWKTMERYIEEDPVNFPAIKKDRAMSLRYKHWLDEGRKLMRGEYNYGAPTVWQTCMRNMFKDVKWDQREVEHNVEPSEQAKFQISQIKSLKPGNHE